MRFLVSLCVFAAFVASCQATGANGSPWVVHSRANPMRLMTFNIGMFQQNKQQLFDRILDISNPLSANYSRWMTIDEVNAIVSPAPAVKEAVRATLAAANIKVVADKGDYFIVEARATHVEHTFATTVHEFRHEKTGARIVRAKGYTIPASLKKHVEIVSGLTELPRSTLKPRIHGEKPSVSAVHNPAFEQIIPQFLRLIYNISDSISLSGTNSSICVAEFQDDQAYLSSDMLLFYKNMAEPAYKIKHVGPFSVSQGPDAESSLDIQFGPAIGKGAQAWFWVDATWMYSFSQALFSTPDAPLVVSMSWGWPENGQCQPGLANCNNPKDYVDRTNTEFAKVTARGISLLAASGDQGAPGDNFPGCSAGLSDLFPSSSPWVTSVGATMVGNAVGNDEPLNEEEASPVNAPVCLKRSVNCAKGDVTSEEVCTYPNALITSGGGFSQYTASPSWQQAAVSKYFNQAVPFPPSSMYNRQGRAFPDVAALGHNYLVYLQGQIVPVDGTSCSSPVFAGLVALLNGQRMKAGKKPLGFLNPMIYQLATSTPSAFRDITKGNNFCTEGCCSSYGWTSAKGWDPVTGWGSPNFPVILSYVMSLP